MLLNPLGAKYKIEYHLEELVVVICEILTKAFLVLFVFGQIVHKESDRIGSCLVTSEENEMSVCDDFGVCQCS